MNMILKKKQSCLKREPLQTDIVIFTSCFKGTQLTKKTGADETKDLPQIFVGEDGSEN